VTGRDPVQPDEFWTVDEPVRGLLSAWRAELDDWTAAAMSTDDVVLPSSSRRWIRAHRRTAAATALVVALAGSTGVAAAASGSSGPLGGLHKFFYGSPAKPHVDALARKAGDKLDAAATGIRLAQAAGGITTVTRNRLAGLLDDAQQLLDRDMQPTNALDARLSKLRTELAAIPVSDPAQPSVADDHGSGGHGSDDTVGSDDRSGRDGGGGQGGDDGSGDHHGDERRGLVGLRRRHQRRRVIGLRRRHERRW
jgi:hypothetical protein